MDAFRVGFVALVDDERPASAVDALERAATFYAAQGVRIERVLTDDGSPYRSRANAAALERMGVRHKRTWAGLVPQSALVSNLGGNQT